MTTASHGSSDIGRRHPVRFGVGIGILAGAALPLFALVWMLFDYATQEYIGSEVEIVRFVMVVVAMVTLQIDLQDGFSSDIVRVLVDGQPVLELEDVSTDYSIGLAASAETEVAPGLHRVEVTLPSQQLSAIQDVRMADSLYLGVSIDEGRIEFRISQEPFVYF